MIPLSIVVAVADNGVIGCENRLVWRLKTDMARFRRLTIGRPVIMGRKTWDSIGRPLPGRDSIVLSRDPGFRPEGAHVAPDWEAAKASAHDRAAASGADGIAVIGGAELYRIALPEVDRLHLTQVHARPEGDVLFPAYDPVAFAELLREDHPASAGDEHPFTFVDLQRRTRDVSPER